MRFLGRQNGTFAFPSTPFVLASVVLSIVLCASLFQHEAVAGLGGEVAQKARESYEGVKSRIHLASPASPNDAAYLEPEWMFAKDISIVYTVRATPQQTLRRCITEEQESAFSAVGEWQ